MELEKFVEIDALYTLYRELLTSKQQEVMEYYYQQDYSLSEISDLMKISRQAVHDNIKRTQTQLYEYEAKLHLLKKSAVSEKILELLEELSHHLRGNSSQTKALLEQIKEQCEELSE